MNQINENSKVRFYHTPKAGGTTIFNMTEGWKNFSRVHPRLNHVQIKYYPPGPDEIGLTVIRHPYSRFISAFYHMVDACDNKFYYRNALVSDCDQLRRFKINFRIFKNDPNEFLYALDQKNHPFHREAKTIFNHFSIFKPQFYWLSDFNKNVHESLQIILRQENLKKEFETVANRLGYFPDWPDESKTNHRITKNTIPLNELSKTLIQKYYQDDFNHFNFEP